MRPGLKAFLSIVFLIFVCVGWTVFWWVAADATESGLNDWFAQERVVGRVWTCAERNVSGYPFRIEVRCAKPTFSGVVGGARAEGSIGDIVAVAHVYQPTLIVADIAPPLRIRAQPDRGSADVDWTELKVSYRSGDGALRLGSLVVVEPRLTARPITTPDIEGRAKRLELHVRPNPASLNAFDVSFSAEGVLAPFLNDVSGSADPLSVVAGATIEKLDAFSRPANGSPLERWRRAGGSARISELRFLKGAAEVAATGTLDLDEAHRVHGTLDILSKSVGPILERFRIPAAALAIGSLLGGSSQPTPPGTTRIPLRLEDGRVSLGPIRLPVALTPLY